MSRRTAATIPRGKPHLPEPDPDAPGTCQICHRPLGTTNDMHITAAELPPVDPAVAELEARRLGEHEGA